MLFAPFAARTLFLANRTVMSPMPRNRALEAATPTLLMAEYYGQRATAGLIGAVPVFLLPGSPAAVRLGLDRLVLPELRHLLGQLRKNEKDGRG